MEESPPSKYTFRLLCKRVEGCEVKGYDAPIFILQGTHLGDGNIHSVGPYGQNCNLIDDPSGQIWVNSPLPTTRARRHIEK